MKLQKKLEIVVCQVQANYKVEKKNPAFLAILQLVADYEGFGISAEELQKDLLKPLSIPACKNILTRLQNMDFLETVEQGEVYFQLSKLGEEVVRKETFFEEKMGILEISYLKEGRKFIPEKIVKIEEKNIDYIDEKAISSTHNSLKKLADGTTILPLRKNYILDKIESKCIKKPIIQKILTLNSSEKNTEISIADYKRLDESINLQQIKNEVLSNEFNLLFNTEKQWLELPFTANDLSFIRDFSIRKPKFNNEVFNEIKVSNLQVVPKDFYNAIEWYKAILKSRINQYFTSETEFEEYKAKIAGEFPIYSKELFDTLISRSDLTESLDNKADFYKIAKLETMDFLTYA